LVVFVILLYLKFFRLGLVWASLGGLFLDFLSSTPPGLFLLGYLIIYLILFLVLRPIELEEFLALLIIVFFSSIIFDLFSIGYFSLIHYHLPLKIFFNIMIFDGLSNVILCLLLYPIMVSLNKHFLSRKQKVISLVEMYK